MIDAVKELRETVDKMTPTERNAARAAIRKAAAVCEETVSPEHGDEHNCGALCARDAILSALEPEK